MIDWNYIIEGSILFGKRQEKAEKRANSKSSGRHSIDSIDQLVKSPGVTKSDITKKKK